MFFPRLLFVSASVPESTAEQVHEQASIQQPGQTVYSAHVQYVEANDQAIYSAANGQMYDWIVDEFRCEFVG